MKKIVNIVIVICLMSVSLQSFSQIQFGVKGGLNLAGMTVKGDQTNLMSDQSSKLGFHLGATADFQITKEFFIQPAVLFSTKGEKYKVSLVDVDITTNINYIEIPINALYKMKMGKFDLFGFAGPYFGYAISGKVKASEAVLGDNGDSKEQDLHIGTDKAKDDIKPIDFGLNIGAGIEMNNITFDIQYGLGFSNISVVTDGGNSAKNHVLGLSVGYKFGK